MNLEISTVFVEENPTNMLLKQGKLHTINIFKPEGMYTQLLFSTIPPSKTVDTDLWNQM